MKRWTAIALLAGVALTAPAWATPTVIVDTTPGTATNDGTINPAEYVGASSGINTGFGDVIGATSLLNIDSSAAGLLNVGLDRGAGGHFDRSVIYIDSKAGGFNTTSGFTDVGDPLRRAISGRNGFNGTGNTVLNFAPGFEADFAIAFDTGFAGVWELTSGSHNFVNSASLNPTGDATAAGFEMNLTLADLGLSPGGSFNYVMTYLNSEDGGGPFRSNEFHGVAQTTVPGGNPGQGAVTLAAGDFNTFLSVPEPASMGLIGLGLVGLMGRRRIR